MKDAAGDRRLARRRSSSSSATERALPASMRPAIRTMVAHPPAAPAGPREQDHRRLFQVSLNWPTPITVKIDDPGARSTTFKGKSFNINDEVYTYAQIPSRDNVHVLTSIDYSMMSDSTRRRRTRSGPITITG
jgi:hypothetical protein